MRIMYYDNNSSIAHGKFNHKTLFLNYVTDCLPNLSMNKGLNFVTWEYRSLISALKMVGGDYFIVYLSSSIFGNY